MPNGQALAVEEKANGRNANSKVYAQFQGKESDAEALIEAAKADFQTIRKRTRIFDMKLYVKPEENAAYHVINRIFHGKSSIDIKRGGGHRFHGRPPPLVFSHYFIA